MDDHTQPVQHVHGGRGRESTQRLQCAERERDPAKVPTIADLVPLTEIMSRDVTCAQRDLDAKQVARLMLRAHIGCIPVLDALGRPTGMITKLDLVEELVGIDDGPAPGLNARTADQIMMPLAIVLDEHATIAHAAALMAGEDIHHTCVVDGDGCLIGIVSTMDIVRWLARNDGFNPVAP
jgi:CBS domain-containing protein